MKNSNNTLRRFYKSSLIVLVLLLASVLGMSQIVKPAYATHSNLAAVWHLDEGMDQVASDSSGHSNDGTLGSTSGIDAADPAWVSGRFGTALSFAPGVDDFVQVPNDLMSLNLEPTKISVEAWVKSLGSPGAINYVLSKGASACTAASYALYTGGSGGLIFYIFNGQTFALSPDAGTGVWDGNWHHVVGTFDSSTVRLYVDGVEIGAGTPAGGIGIGYGLSDTNDLFFGRYSGSCTLSFSGEIDEVRIWSRDLTAAEIAISAAGHFSQLATAGLVLFSPSAFKATGNTGSVPFEIVPSDPSTFITNVDFRIPETTPQGSIACIDDDMAIINSGCTTTMPDDGFGQTTGMPRSVTVFFANHMTSSAKTIHLALVLDTGMTLESIGVNIQLPTWRPYGPHVENIVIKFYGGADGEFAAFEAGDLDLTDASVPLAKIAQYLSNPDFFVSQEQEFVALNGWDGIVNQLRPDGSRVGFGNFWTAYNMRVQTGYVPVNPLYTPGGGDSELIRWGFKAGTNTLNVFRVTTAEEIAILREIYDPMLIRNPLNPSQIIDWMTRSHQVILDTKRDITTLRFVLRSDLEWNDGVELTSDDVIFSIINYRDVPGNAFSQFVQDVIRARSRRQTLLFPIGDTVLKIRLDIVEVILKGANTAHEFNIGRVPIVPQHVWDTDGNGKVDPGKLDPAFDPMASGALIGSGPYLCRDPTTATPGGGCGSNGTQTMGAGDSLSLSRNEKHMRDALLVTTKFTNLADPSAPPGTQTTIANLHAFNWADANDDLKIDIVDLAIVSFAFGTSNPYWDDRVYGAIPGTVDLAEVHVVAGLFGTTLCGVFGPRCTSLDPGDPYYVGGIFTKTVIVTATALNSRTVSLELFNKGVTETLATVDVIGLQNGVATVPVPACASPIIPLPTCATAIVDLSGTYPSDAEFVKFKIQAAGDEDTFRTPKI